MNVYNTQFPKKCERILLVNIDMLGAGFGFVAKLLVKAMAISFKYKRTMIEYKSPSPLWCQHPPFTLECYYSKWSNCSAYSGEKHVTFSHASSRDRVAYMSLTKFWHSGLWSKRIKTPYPDFENHSFSIMFQLNTMMQEEVHRILYTCRFEQGKFLTIHLRNSPEKTRERGKMPSFESYIAKIPQNISHIFWQTSNPTFYRNIIAFAETHKDKIHCFTNETRYENDVWGRSSTNKSILEQMSRTTVVNGYLGRIGGLGIISPQKSMWTWFLLFNTFQKQYLI